MSLATLVRTGLAAVLLLAAAAVGLVSGPAIRGYLAEAQFSTTVDADIDSRSLVYRLDKTRPLTFFFTQPVERVRMLSLAAVAPRWRNAPDGFAYAIELRLFDGAGQEALRQKFDLHSDAPDLVYATGENWRFFRNRPELVAGLDDVVIAPPRPVVRSEWRLVGADPRINSVDIRVYERQPLLASQAATSFRRRSDEERVRMAAANAFPSDMLTAGEIANLSTNMWRPLGPAGVAGRDYRALVLYEGTRRPPAGEIEE
ncbi:hypothetical protein WAB17_06175 [Parerythrobacter aurantius]|uniref:hypothetical protein n=1 Tax=Parerythrobacter aurantius TaxID=3127706 RepID=UPI003249FE81